MVHATGVNAPGYRERLGVDLVTAEDGAAWLAFVRGLVARGLSGVQLIASDAHPGLVDAIRSTLPGASWQRARAAQHAPRPATLVRTIFDQADAELVQQQFARALAQRRECSPATAELLEEAGPAPLSLAVYPPSVWRQTWSSNPIERLNRKIRRRTDVVSTFPTLDSVIRLVGAVRCEQLEERISAERRYLAPHVLAATRRLVEPAAPQVVNVAA